MPLANIIEEFVADVEWGDPVECDEETGESQLSTKIEIMNQSFMLYIEGDEKRERFTLNLFAPFQVIEGKSIDAQMLFNFINDSYYFSGRLSLTDEGGIRYKQVIDTDNLEPAAAMIHNMLASATALFKYHIDAIAAVAMTSKTYEAVRKDYDKKAALKAARNQSE
ncbi:MAG: YbjN domain-containing protein [Chlorobiaceae bacterium]|nr:YbjN domain-containing protein [Chlorobiaceae bacterium]